MHGGKGRGEEQPSQPKVESPSLRGSRCRLSARIAIRTM
jgi:hypothetical protein